jgi:hypothetical protein
VLDLVRVCERKSVLVGQGVSRVDVHLKIGAAGSDSNRLSLVGHQSPFPRLALSQSAS